jgi:nitroimidazol reductase NimA-like FMN-containing flavoprotein (pyridoxamine 5'-phosphate oxidase superfamily)
MHVRSLSTLECTKLLSAGRIGRLACVSEGRPYVVPIYFTYADHHLYAFSMPGKKIEWMRANPHVSVVAEEHGPGREWKSVIVDGLYEELPRQDDRDHAWSLLSRHTDWWEPGALKPFAQPLSYHSDHVFYRVIIEEVSGREARESA